MYISTLRDVAQLGSAPALGAGCHRFESCHPDTKNQLANSNKLLDTLYRRAYSITKDRK